MFLTDSLTVFPKPIFTLNQIQITMKIKLRYLLSRPMHTISYQLLNWKIASNWRRPLKKAVATA